jgi:hypothetical protein
MCTIYIVTTKINIGLKNNFPILTIMKLKSIIEMKVDGLCFFNRFNKIILIPVI